MSILNKITKSRQTIIEMMDSRGFNMDKYHNFSQEELGVIIKHVDKKLTSELTPLDIVCNHNTIENKKCVVKYIHSNFRKISKIDLYIKEIIENEIVDENDDLVFVVADKINNMDPFYDLFNKIYGKEKIYIQILDINKLQRNITKHEMVPLMRIVSKEETDIVKKKYNIDNMSNFPIILVSDPVAQYYGVKKGDLCEILRKSETSGEYKSYRYCE